MDLLNRVSEVNKIDLDDLIGDLLNHSAAATQYRNYVISSIMKDYTVSKEEAVELLEWADKNWDISK